MKHIKKQQAFCPQNTFVDKFFQKDCIFFDIETTGFSPASGTLYLIGCMYQKEHTLYMEQFFAEHPSEEQMLLEHFSDLLSDFQTMISFNGLGFDIPYLKAKYATYQIQTDFSDWKQLDIFKEVGNLKALLSLPNYKQKTIEQFLGISREDSFTGGELIRVYKNYIQNKSDKSEHLLLLHNFEDVLGMLDLLPILSYKNILNGQHSFMETSISPYTTYEGETKQELIITLKNECPLPQRVSAKHHDFYLTLDKEVSRIRIPIFEGELRFFYPNCKDYFYLPKEDMAIHKSVAEFVDKEFRQKAKACNCYTRKTGAFLPQYDAVMTPLFLKEYKDKCSYFELTEDFLKSPESITAYADHILQMYKKKSPKK